MQQQKNTYNNALKKLLCAVGFFSLSCAWLVPALAQQSDAVDIVNTTVSTVDSAPSTNVVEQENWNAKFQSTYIWQRKRAFSAPYSGAMSLRPERERSYSLTATASLPR